MEELERRGLLGLVGISALAAITAKASAGPLNPPSGAVAPSGRTTDEIFNKIPSGGAGDGRTAIFGGTFPVSITTSGSYVLTGWVNVGPTSVGISINADNVTLDLNGYAVGSSSATGTGIVVNSGLRGVTIRNGHVFGFASGVSMSSNNSGVVLEDLEIRDARLSGIVQSGNGTRELIIRRCSIVGTGSTTFATDGNLTIAGISVSASSCLIEDCLISRLSYNGNGVATLRGILATGGINSLVRRCTFTSDTNVAGTGIALVGSWIRRDNTVFAATTPYSGGTDGGGNV
jgi:hypothetical protein